MATHLRIYGKDKTPLGLLPDHEGLVNQIVLNAPGSLTFNYPMSGIGVGLLDADAAYLSILENGVEHVDWYLLDDDTDNQADAKGAARPLQVSARGLLALLEQAQVYPKKHVPGGEVNKLDPKHDFDDSTPGSILKTLLDRAKARGCFPDLTYSFTTTHDSAGQPWPKKYDVSYTAGLDYLSLVTAMADNGWIDVHMNGFELQAFVPDTVLGGSMLPIYLRLGQQVLDGPRKRSRRGIVSHLLGIGEEKNLVEVKNDSTAARYGRREGNVSDGRMTTNGSLRELASETLKDLTDAKEGITLKLALNPPKGETWAKPGQDYTVGHRIGYDQRRDANGDYEPMRVRTITWEWGSAGADATCSLEVNDVFVEGRIRTRRRVEGILNGSVTDAPPPKQAPVDKTVPKAPTSLAVTPFNYFEGGANYAGVNASWTAVTRNTDDSDYEDHSAYALAYRIGGGEWVPMPSVEGPECFFEKLPPAKTFEMRVAACDTSAHRSDWTVSSPLMLPRDLEPPQHPSKLIGTTRLGTVTLLWDGRDHAGAKMADDFSHLMVYRSEDPSVLAPAGELVGRMYAANGTIVLSGLPYNVPQYFTAVAVDFTGNVSVECSLPVVVTTQPLVGSDVIGPVIDGAANILERSIPGTAVEFGAIALPNLDQSTQDSITSAQTRLDEQAASIGDLNDDLTGLSGKVDGKSTVYVQATQPHDSNLATDVGDVWIDTANGRIIKTYDGSNWIVSDDVRLASTLATVNTKVTTFYGSATPTATAIGDLWIDTGHNNQLMRATATGTAGWVLVSDTRIAAQAEAIGTIQTDLTSIEGKVDGKSTVWVQNTDPSSNAVPAWGADQTGDVWVDTSGATRVVKVWNGSAWVEADSRTASALSTAQSKITTFYAANTAVPAATAIGDLWIVTNEGNRIKRASAVGTGSWVYVDDARIATQAGQIATLQTDLTTANGRIDGKAVVWVQSTAPSGLVAADQGDIWINTSTTNRITKVWDGAAWQDVTDQKTLDVLATTNTKVTTFYAASTAVPTATAVGDLWIVTDKGNLIRRATATGTGSWADLAIGAGGLSISVGGGNLVYNSSFEAGTSAIGDGWYAWTRGAGDAGRTVTAQRVTGLFPGSAYAQRVTTTNPTNVEATALHTSEKFAIAGGVKAVLSAYLRASAAMNMNVSLRCEKNDGTYVGEASYVAAMTTTAQRFIGLVTVPAGTERCQVGFTGPNSPANGSWFEVDGVQVELGDVATAYAPKVGEILPGTVSAAMVNFDARALGAMTTYYQTAQPTSGMKTGDLWIDTDDKNKVYRYSGSTWQVADDQRIGEAITAAAGAQATADGKVRTYAQATAPVGTTQVPLALGDLWVDTDDANKLYRYAGSTAGWESIADARIATQAQQISTLQTDLTTANGRIDGKAVIWVQATAPSGLVAADQGDIWINTSTTDRITKVWDGAAWQNITDQKTLDVLGTVNGKVTTFYAASSSAPSATAIGDLWIVSDDSNRIKRATALGTSGWVFVDDARIATQAGQISTLQTNLTGLDGRVDGKSTVWVQNTNPSSGANPAWGVAEKGDIWIDTTTADRITRVWDGSAFQHITDQATLDVLATVKTKTTTYYSATAPNATAIGDLWIDSDDNRMYRATAVGTNSWVEIADSRIAAQATAIGQLQTDLTATNGKVDGKAVVYVQSTDPKGAGWGAGETGDVWVDTTGGNRVVKVWNGSAWVEADSRTATALSTAQSKITTFYAASTAVPTALAVGDLWIVTDDNNRIKRASAVGTGSWVYVDDARIAAQATAIGTLQSDLTTANGKIDGKSTVYVQNTDPKGAGWGVGETGDVWVDTTGGTRVVKVWNGSAWQEADSRTATALSTAQSKITTFYAASTATPTALAIGDLWIVTDDSNRIKRASSTGTGGWVYVDDTRIAAQASQISTLQTGLTTANGRIDGKAVVYVQSTAPTGLVAADQGDIWINTSTADRITKVWDGAAWQNITDQKTLDVLGTVNTKVTTYYGGTYPSTNPPTAPSGGFTAGDLWVDSASKVARWSGSAWTALDLTTGSYVQSRGTDLVSNGTGLLGTNYNFTAFTFTKADAPPGASGSFLTPLGDNGTKYADELIPVDPGKKYVLSCWARQTATGRSSAVFYYGLAPYDAFGNSIQPVNYLYRIGTTTTLAQPLNVGDTKVYLTSAANWINNAGTNSSARTIIFWDFTDAGGKLWPEHTYSRNVSTYDIYADGAVDTTANTITLRAPWAGPAKPAGTKLSNGGSGGSFMYSVSNTAIPEAWTQFVGQPITGVYAQTGANGTLNASATYAFPAGTAAVKVMWLPNRTLASPFDDDLSRHAFAGVSFSDATAAQQAATGAQTTADVANAVAEAAALATGASSNPIFSKWASGATYPTDWASWGALLPKLETTLVRTRPNAIRWTGTDSSTQAGVTGTSSALLKALPLGLEYVTVELDFQLVSGALGGAGLLLDWRGMGTGNRVTINLSTEVPTPVLGQWYRVTKVLRRPAGLTGTQTGWDTWLMANYNGNGFTLAQKDIVFDRVQFRASTNEEIKAFGMDAAIATAVSTSASGKNKVTWSVDAPSGSGTVAGDVWFQRNVTTGVASGQWEWDGQAWQPRTLGDQTIAGLNVSKLVGDFIDAQHIKVGSGVTFESGFDPRFAGLESTAAGFLVLKYPFTGGSEGAQVGSYVIDTGIPFAGHMCRVNVIGYNNLPSGQSEIKVSFGFTASAAGGNPALVNTDYTTTGSSRIAGRLARSVATGNVALILDPPTAGWESARFAVTEAAGSGLAASMGQGWTGKFTADLSGYTLITTPPARDIDETYGLTQQWRVTGTTQIDGGNLANDSVRTRHLEAGAATVEKLTVGAVGDSVVVNGRFEEVSSTDPTLPARWGVAVGNWPTSAANRTWLTSGPLSGTRSIGLVIPAVGDGSSATLVSNWFPVAEGERWYGRLVASSTLGNSPGFYFRLQGGPDALEGIPGYVNIVGNTTVPATATTYEGAVTIPAGWRWARVLLLHHGPTATSANTIYVDNVEARRTVVSAVLEDGAITTPKIKARNVVAESMAINSVLAEHIGVGQVEAEHIKLGTFNSNLVPDPSFEESYPIEDRGTAAINRWRIDATGGTGGTTYIKRVAGGRSGRQSLRLHADAAMWTRCISGNFDVTAGKTYMVSVYAGKLQAQTSRLYVRILGGSNDNLTEYPATQAANSIPWVDSADAIENVNVSLISDAGNSAGYDLLSYAFTVPSGIKRASVMLFNYSPSGTSDIVIDDVAVVELGKGATEITAAGLRLFGTDGTEVGAFVSNRPNYFSITRDDQTVAGIDADGNATFEEVVSNQDPVFMGQQLLGNFADWQSPTESDANQLGWLDKVPRGIVAVGANSWASGSWTTRRGLFEISFEAQRGRTYRAHFGGFHASIATAGVTTGFGVNLLWPATLDGEAPSPNMSNGATLMFSQLVVSAAGKAMTFPAQSRVMRCNVSGDPAVGGELRAGINKLFVYVTGDLATITPSPADQMWLWVEDIGPDAPLTDVPNSSTVATPVTTTTKKTYTSYWQANSSESYRGANTARTDTDDLVQGRDPSGYNGDGHAVVLFTGTAYAGEKGKSIATALSGATVKKVEVYLYNRSWYYNAGGTARIRAYTSSSLSSATPSGSYKDSSGWPKGSGRWVDITSISTSAIRGVTLGKGGSSYTFYGRFSGHAQGNPPKLRITYVR